MNHEECVQIVRVLVGPENMLWFSKGNYRARLKHNTSGQLKLPVACFESKTDKVLFPQLIKIKPRVNTDSIKCVLRQLFIHPVLL